MRFYKQEGTNNVRPAPISAIASTAVKPLIQKTTTTSTSTTSILAKSGGLCATITPVVASSSSSSSSAAANGTSTSSNEKQGEVDRDVSPPLSHSVVVNNHDQNSIQNHNDNSATLRSDQSPLKQPATTTTIQLINTPLPSTGKLLILVYVAENSHFDSPKYEFNISITSTNWYTITERKLIRQNIDSITLFQQCFGKSIKVCEFDIKINSNFFKASNYIETKV